MTQQALQAIIGFAITMDELFPKVGWRRNCWYKGNFVDVVLKYVKGTS
jgi:hypothetical protein